MAQVRICLSCGTIWKDGTLAYIDGFCLHCPGELGPPTDAAKAGDAAWAAKVAATAAAAAKIETTGKPAQVDLGAITATRQSPRTPPLESPREYTDITTAISPDEGTGSTSWENEESTTSAVGGDAGPDDLEPGKVRSPSSALTKLAMPALLPGQSGQNPATTLSGSQVEIKLDALKQDPGTARSSRRHPGSGTGDTTAEIVVGDMAAGSGSPSGAATRVPPIRPTAAPAPSASPTKDPPSISTTVQPRDPMARTAGLPPKLATLAWTCRGCKAVYPPGSACIPTKRCSACLAKLQPELAAVPPGMPSLLLYDPDTKVRIGRFAVTGDVFLIGRVDPGANLFPELNLADWLSPDDARQLSRRHCEVLRDRNSIPEGWVLAPAQGNSGVYIKGALVEPPARVRLTGQEVFGLGGDRIFLRFEAPGTGSGG